MLQKTLLSFKDTCHDSQKMYAIKVCVLCTVYSSKLFSIYVVRQWLYFTMSTFVVSGAITCSSCFDLDFLASGFISTLQITGWLSHRVGIRNIHACICMCVYVWQHTECTYRRCTANRLKIHPKSTKSSISSVKHSKIPYSLHKEISHRIALKFFNFVYVLVVKIRFANGMYQYFRTLHNLKPVYITLYNGLISINPNTLTLCSQFPKFNR